ncbi:MAG: MFS transporter [Deltaproteobacteria bacterium]|nr:MFS transporter [bacterium]MCB9489669.1 MFS transporter [Deltaproteobacteria bacterium]
MTRPDDPTASGAPTAPALPAPRSPLLAMYLAAGLSGMMMISYGPMLDAIVADVHMERAQAGIVSLTFFLGMNIGIFLLNFVIGGLKSRRTMALGAAMQFVGLLLFSRATSLAGLSLTYLLTGAGYGILIVYPGVYISSLFKENTERPMTFTFGFFAAGVTLTPALIGWGLDAGVSWRHLVLLEAAITLAVLLFFPFATLHDIPDRANLNRTEIQRTWRHNARLWVAMFGAVMFYVGAEGIFNVWLAKFQIDVFARSPMRAALSVTIFWIGLTIGRLAGAHFVGRLGPHRVIAVSGVVMGAATVGTALSEGAFASDVYALLAGLAASIIFPVATAYSGRFPDWLSGVVYSSCVFAAGIGNMFFPYLVGYVADWTNFRWAMTVGVVPIVGVIVLTWIGHRAAEG